MIHLGMVDIWPLDGGLQLHGRSLLNLHQVMQTKQQRFPSPTKTHFLKVFLGISKDLKDGLIFHLGFHLWMPNEESLQAVVAKKVEKPATAITLHGSSRNCHHWWWWRAQKDCIECTFFLLRIECTSSRPPLASCLPGPLFQVHSVLLLCFS